MEQIELSGEDKARVDTLRGLIAKHTTEMARILAKGAGENLTEAQERSLILVYAPTREVARAAKNAGQAALAATSAAEKARLAAGPSALGVTCICHDGACHCCDEGGGCWCQQM